MSNTFLSPTIITRKALMILHNNLTFAKNVDRQYDKTFANSGASVSGKIGPSLRIRKPNQYTVRSGAAIDLQDNTEASVTLNVTTQKGVDMHFSSADLTLTIDEFSDRYLEPAMARIASQVDYDGMSLFSDIYNQVGTAGTTPASALVYLEAGAKLDDNAAPRNDRCVVVNPAAQAATVNALTGLFHSSEKISAQYDKGEMGTALGFKFNMDQNVNRLTCGTRVGTILIDGTIATEGSSTIHIDGLTNATDTVKAGEIFTVAAVYSVNPETKQSNGTLQQFVVTADATAASNEVDLSVSPAMYTSASGVLQTIDAFPQDGAVVTFTGTASTAYPYNMAFQKEAFTLATADLVLPRGVDFAAREVYDNISLRIVRQYDVNNDRFPCRIDVLYGWLTQRPELACRIIG